MVSGPAAPSAPPGPETPDGIFEQALRAQRNGDAARAEALYKRLLATQPRHAGALANLALLRLAAKDSDMALFLVRQALDIRPDQAAARHVLALVLAARGEAAQAAMQCRGALACIGPDQEAAAGPLLRELGTVLLGLKDLDGARQALERAARALPDDAEARAALASTLFAMDDLPAARPHYAWLLERAPDDPKALADMGHILTMSGEFDAARSLLERSLALRETGPGRFRLASLDFRRGDLEAAARGMGAAAELDKASAAARRFLHYIRCLLGGRDEAEVALGGVRARFGLTGRNLAVEIAHANGEFYEPRELDYLRQAVPRPDAVLDVGANSGNHAVYFILGMGARRVTPFEIHPAMTAALRDNIRRNGLGERMDFSLLGTALSDAPGRARLEEHPARDLCLTELVPDPDGDLAVEPLDALDAPPAQLIKVDVQGGETAFLDGARNYLRAHRPHLLMEVNDVNQRAFAERARALGYVPKTVFRSAGYGNVHLAPEDA